MSMKMKGFDNLQNLLDALQKEVNEIAGGKFVKFKNLLTDEFMGKHTKFKTMEDFFEQSPFEVKTQEQFEEVDQEELDAFTKESTEYESFNEMMQHAANLYIKKELEKKGIKTN